MSEELNDRREACLDELNFLAEQLALALSPNHRELYLLIRQSRIIELNAIERFLGMNPVSKAANRKRYNNL